MLLVIHSENELALGRSRNNKNDSGHGGRTPVGEGLKPTERKLFRVRVEINNADTQSVRVLNNEDRTVVEAICRELHEQCGGIIM